MIIVLKKIKRFPGNRRRFPQWQSPKSHWPNPSNHTPSLEFQVQVKLRSSPPVLSCPTQSRRTLQRPSIRRLHWLPTGRALTHMAALPGAGSRSWFSLRSAHASALHSELSGGSSTRMATQ